MKRYLLPTAFGFIGMFAAHFLLLILFIGLRLNFMPYIIVYPVVYIILAFLFTRNNPDRWLLNAVCILIIPFIYWYLLLYSDGKFYLADAMKVGESSGMLLVLPFTFLLVMMVSLYIHKRKRFVNGQQ